MSCVAYSSSFLHAVFPVYSPVMSLTCLFAPHVPTLFKKSYPISFILNFFFFLIKAQSQNTTFNRQSNILPSFYLYTGSQCSTKIALLNECKTEFSWLTLVKGSCIGEKKDYIFQIISATLFIIIIASIFYCILEYILNGILILISFFFMRVQIIWDN